eukprot:COSAG02_NODE_55646_length_289_cov_0.994737_1_plen_81_part_01
MAVEEGVEGAEEEKRLYDLRMDSFVTAVDRLSEMIENPVRQSTVVNWMTHAVYASRVQLSKFKQRCILLTPRFVFLDRMLS